MRNISVVGLLALTLTAALLLSRGTMTSSASGSCPSPYTSSVQASPSSTDNPQGMAVGDFNGDGKLDIAIANHGIPQNGGTFPGSIAVFIGTGTGTFSAPTNYVVGYNPIDVAVADFNGDNKLDIVSANYGFDVSKVSILFGTGTGTFGAPANYNSNGSNPYGVVAADFNNDGKPDVAVTNSTSSNIGVFLNTGTGALGPVTNYTVGSVPRGIAASDFNNDGKLDIVTTSTANVSVILNTGAGSFGPLSNYPTGTGPLGVITHDFDGDGDQDIATTNVNANSVSILFNNGSAVFQAPVNYGTGSGPSGITKGDFDGDGIIDLAVANKNSAYVTVLLGAGGGNFQSPLSYGPNGASDVVAGDFNNDGGVDLAIDGIRVLLNNCTQSDLILTKTHVGNFRPGTNGVYTLTVKNNGGVAIGGTTTVTDTLPTGLSYVSGTGTNWSCAAVGQVVTCTTNDVIPAGSSTVITLTVLPNTLATPKVTNTASVSNPNDGQPGNNSASDVTKVLGIVPANFDGDFTTDVSLWRPSTGDWIVYNGVVIQPDWGRGSLGDKPVPGDYDGDGTTDVAIFRPSEGNWYIILSSTHTIRLNNWGGAGDIPVPKDYDGDLKTDIAVFRPSDGNWYIVRSSDNGVTLRGWGINGDKPVPGDYDADGKDDIAVWRPSEGNWYVLRSATNTGQVQNWGATTDQPVPGDYDGDHKIDFAVYRATEGNWYVLKSSTGTGMLKNWGTNNDQPVPGDYDGDGKTDYAIWRPSEGRWYVTSSSACCPYTTVLGMSGDVLLPATYIPQ
ncbi:MAG: hypothetical protein QOF02_1338 [Blastocatellia bacterium]|jgi:uncharacterized repeat protein (TIGR01451 family)|nr:hypothetical protein [Blastocatellia bacterium]